MTSGEDELTPLEWKLEKIARDIGIFGLIAAILIFCILIGKLIYTGVTDEWEEASHYIQEVKEYFIISITILVVAIQKDFLWLSHYP